MSTLCTRRLVTFLATLGCSQQREMYMRMTLGRISFMFSRSRRSTLLFPILRTPSAPLTRASYHPPSTLRRDHRVIRPSAASPSDPFRVRPQIDVLFLSIKIDCGSAAICVSCSQLHCMIVSSLRQDRHIGQDRLEVD